jgi:hypothetical protein
MPELIRSTLVNLQNYPAQQAHLQTELASLKSEVIKQADRTKHRAVGIIVSALGLVGLHTPYLWNFDMSVSLIGLGLVWLLIRG